MKTYLVWLPVSVIALTTAVISPVQKVFTGRKTASQSIEFAVYKEKDYSAEAYKYTSAQVHIVIEKVGSKNRTAVWDTTIAYQEIKDFPGMQNAQIEKITIPGLIEKKEHLEITYFLTYDSNGSQLQMQGNGAYSDDCKKINISI